MRWVWLETTMGRVPVNPDQVAYLRPPARDGGGVRLVFGAAAAGLHELEAVGTVFDVAEALESGPVSSGDEPSAPSADDAAAYDAMSQDLAARVPPPAPPPKAKGPPKRTALKRGKARR